MYVYDVMTEQCCQASNQSSCAAEKGACSVAKVPGHMYHHLHLMTNNPRAAQAVGLQPMLC
jgi:hypothetical protein